MDGCAIPGCAKGILTCQQRPARPDVELMLKTLLRQTRGIRWPSCVVHACDITAVAALGSGVVDGPPLVFLPPPHVRCTIIPSVSACAAPEEGSTPRTPYTQHIIMRIALYMYLCI